MATTDSIQDSTFEGLVFIQTSLDEFSNLKPKSTLQCRALVKNQSRRCLNNGYSTKEHSKVEDLLSEFDNITECPETEIFYENMKLLITYTHCARHTKVALTTFREWKKRQTAAAPNSPPASLSASASTSTSSFSSSEYTLSASLSEISDLLSKTSLSGGPIYDEPVSDCDSEGVWEKKHEKVVIKEITVLPETQTIEKKMNIPKGSPKAADKIAGVGDIRIPRRKWSKRDHASVFQVINSHPTEKMMKEGTVYILEHVNVRGLFKIGFSTVGAKRRLSQPKNCYGTDTNLIYETKSKFRGAQRAEKIIQTHLFHDNILIGACEQCGGGHREWFEADRDKIFDTVKAIEIFVQMPAYVKKDGEWKLSDRAYEIVGPMCRLDLPGLLKGGREVQKQGTEATPSLEVISEGIASRASQEANMSGKPKETIPKKSLELSNNGEKLGEGQFAELPLRPKSKQRAPLAAS